MSNKHFIKGLRRRQRRSAHTKTITDILGQQHVVRTPELVDVAAAKRAVARRTKAQTNEMARLLQEDLRRKQAITGRVK